MPRRSSTRSSGGRSLRTRSIDAVYDEQSQEEEEEEEVEVEEDEDTSHGTRGSDLLSTLQKIVQNGFNSPLESQNSSLFLSKMQHPSFRDQLMSGSNIPFMVRSYSIANTTQTLRPHQSSFSSGRRREHTAKETDPFSLLDPTKYIAKEERSRIAADMTPMQYTTTQSIGIDVRSEQFFLSLRGLNKRLEKTLRNSGLDNMEEGTRQMVSLAAQDHIRSVIEELVRISKLRVDTNRNSTPIEIVSDPRGMLKLRIKEAALRQRKGEEREKEKLRREIAAMKASKGELSADMKLKEQELKKLESLEEEQQMFDSTNKSALAAAGLSMSFKRKRPRSAGPSGTSSPSLFSNTFPTSSTPSEIRRITLFDVIFYLENDSRLSRSPLMYFTYYRLGQR